MKILIVGNNQASNLLIKKIIEKWGYETITAQDGEEAWELIQKDNVRIIIMDWMMPKMDGVTLCRKIRAAGLPDYIYIILLTSKGRKEDLVNGFSSGADDFAIKPVNPDELRVRIKAGKRIIDLEETAKKSHTQLMQSEKMASIGQLAAGVAHEINNPTGFVSSNLKTLTDYQNDICEVIKKYKKLLADISLSDNMPAPVTEQVNNIIMFEQDVDLDFLLNDITDLIKECREGTERIKKIVLDLKDFAHPGDDKLKSVDINENIDSTLNVVWNEIKYKATVAKEYGELPVVKCYPQQLNQVFMNLLVNAAQAIEGNGEIVISTAALDGYVEIKFSDTGTGIPEENISKLFDPFFTTKEVGKGTGLGLNVSYNIIKKHNGNITVESRVGEGTTFTIQIPV